VASQPQPERSPVRWFRSTPSPLAAKLGDLLGRSAEIGEQPTQCRGALDPELRAEHSAVVEGHGLQRETSALYEVHANAAGLEKRSRHPFRLA